MASTIKKTIAPDNEINKTLIGFSIGSNNHNEIKAIPKDAKNPAM